MVRRLLHTSPAMLGLGDAPQNTSPSGLEPQGYDLVYDVSLTANQLLNDSKTIEHDADFILRAVIINSYTSVNFSLFFSINNWYNLSDGQILAANIVGDSASPYPIWPQLRVPAGGRIFIRSQDLSGAPNTIELVFRGSKVFPS